MPPSKLGSLFYQALRNDNTESLKMNKGEYDATAILSATAKQ